MEITHIWFSRIPIDLLVVPLSLSATSVVQDNRKNALKTDFALTFEKTSESHNSQRPIDSELEQLIQQSHDLELAI